MADDPFHDERLARDLKSLFAPAGSVPSRVDDAILNRARAERARQGRLKLLRWAGAAAAAACLLVVAQVALREPLAPSDLDGNRRVDIVDALRLSRQIDAGEGRDINRDGVIDFRDVDAIAMNVVRLEGGVQ